MKRKKDKKAWDNKDIQAKAEGMAIEKLGILRPKKIGASHNAIIRNTAVRIGQMDRKLDDFASYKIYSSHVDDGQEFINIIDEKEFIRLT